MNPRETASAALTRQEFELVRQAVRNQSNDEDAESSNVECDNCRRRQMHSADQRRRLRESALKKIRPKDCDDLK